MKIKKIIAIVLAVLMLLSGMVFCISAEDSISIDVDSLKNGDVVTYGSYPQTRVTDSKIMSRLEAIVEKNPERLTSFGLTSGSLTVEDYAEQLRILDGAPWDTEIKWMGNLFTQTTGKNDYVSYYDVALDGVKYRIVKIEQAIPNYTSMNPVSFSYEVNKTTEYVSGEDAYYCFRFEPLEWQIADVSTGLAVCVSAVDATPFVSTVLFDEDKELFFSTEKEVYASNYNTSDLHYYLTGKFLTTAFTALEKKYISKSDIFALSPSQYNNSALIFDRYAKGSDYSVAKGSKVTTLITDPEEVNVVSEATYWLKDNPTISYSTSVANSEGIAARYVTDNYVGVRPAMRLDLSAIKADQKSGEIPVKDNDEPQEETSFFARFIAVMKEFIQSFIAKIKTIFEF